MFNKALIIGILLVGASFSISANEVQKWEYECVEYETTSRTLSWRLAQIEEQFNELGEEGWELAAFSPYIEDTRAQSLVCFKRPKRKRSFED